MDFDWIALLVIIFAVIYTLKKMNRNRQLTFLENYRFNAAIGKKVKQKYPHLTDQDIELVMEGLRDYFYICIKAKRRMVSMPSQVVDIAWHEFILFTRAYEGFCKKALGRFLHHTPTEAMKTPTHAQKGIKRAWRLACERNNINPSFPVKLPLLFSIDSQLNIEDGFKYSLNCKDKSSPNNGSSYCATHIGCTSGCAGSSGSSSGSFFGDSGGDSGGGCGGGCGGS